MDMDCTTNQEALRKKAEARLDQSARPVEDLSPEALMALVHDYQVHQIELELQNEELRNAQKQLEITRDQYAELFNNAPVGYLTINQSGIILRTNQAFADMLGHAPETLPGMALHDFLASSDRTVFHGRFKAFFKNPAGKRLVFKLLGKTGELAVRCEGRRESPSPEHPGNDRAARLLLTISDISEQIQAEETLRANEERFRNLIENAPLGVFQTSPQGRYHLVNHEYAHLMGFSTPLEMIEAVEDVTKLFASPADLLAYTKRLQQSGQVRDFETELVRKDGTRFWASINTRVNPMAAGAGISNGFILDITQRRQAEQAVRARERFLSTILATTQDGFWVLDSRGRIVEVNQAYCRMSGYSSDELKRMGIQDLDVLDTPEETATRIQRIIGQGADLYETRHRKKDGSLFDVEISVSYLKDHDARFICFCRDITERNTLTRKIQESEERSRLLADLTMEGIVIHKDGVARDYNASFTRMSGYEREEILGGNLLELVIPEDDRSLVLENIVKEYAQPYVVKFMKKDGGYFFAELEARNFEYRGETLRVAAIRDITERKKFNDALLQSHERLKTILNSIDAFVYIVDMNTYEILFCNEYGRNFWGEIIGLTCWKKIQQNQDGPCAFCTNPKLLDSSGQPTGVHVWEFQNTKNGRWYDCRDRAIPWTDGRMVRIEIATDITERKEAEAKETAVTRQLQAALAEKDKFFSIIAHDLKSPMSGLLSLSKLFADDVARLTSKELHDIASAMHESTRRLHTLLENLLQWALMQKGMMEYSPNVQNLQELVHPGIAPLLSLFEQKQVSIQSRIPDNLLVLADTQMISTVVRNLVSNALKYTHSGGVVDITATVVEDKAVVSVQDTGMGMEQHHLDRIFSLEQHTSRPGTQGESGTGLGLVLCRELVENHGGRIWVESEPGKGTTFHFTIPVQP